MSESVPLWTHRLSALEARGVPYRSWRRPLCLAKTDLDRDLRRATGDSGRKGQGWMPIKDSLPPALPPLPVNVSCSLHQFLQGRRSRTPNRGLRRNVSWPFGSLEVRDEGVGRLAPSGAEGSGPGPPLLLVACGGLWCPLACRRTAPSAFPRPLPWSISCDLPL